MKVINLSAQLSGTFELPHSPGQGQSECAGGEAESRGRIRGLPSATGCGLPLGLRPGNQTTGGNKRMSKEAGIAPPAGGQSTVFQTEDAECQTEFRVGAAGGAPYQNPISQNLSQVPSSSA